jgi:DNA repair protein RecN (Recombination protein N)
MQQLGMAGGRFEVTLLPQDEPQAFGAETVEFRVAGHAGSSPRPLARVASGGELSRLALAIAATAAQQRVRRASAAQANAQTLVFDEIDAGVGGEIAHAVGRLMKQLGSHAQVLAVTHLAQVAACADAHLVVAKSGRAGTTVSSVLPVAGEARVAEVARMLGGGRLSPTSRAHAEAMLGVGGRTQGEVEGS